MIRLHFARALLPVALAVSTLGLAGCNGGPTVDATDEASFKKSVEEVRKPLDEKKRAEFDQAVATLMFSKVLQSPGAFGNEEGAKKVMKETFDGKTADQIIAAAEKEKAVNKAEMEKLMK
jgi:hypothetical protein